MIKKAILYIGLVLLGMTFQNCSGTNFGNLGGSSSEEEVKPTETYEDVPVDVTSVTEMPKITAAIPDCQPNTICHVNFTMKKAHTLAVSYKWRTDDDTNSRWKTDALPANVIWGIAGTHYMAAQGEIIFKPGETSKTIDVQNINQSSNGIRFKVLLNTCMVGTAQYRCDLFF